MSLNSQITNGNNLYAAVKDFVPPASDLPEQVLYLHVDAIILIGPCAGGCPGL